MIDWRSIEDLPDELKDGRPVLVWDADEPTPWQATVATYHEDAEFRWRDDEFRDVRNVTHFAAIEEPGDGE